jgi:alanine racemase
MTFLSGTTAWIDPSAIEHNLGRVIQHLQLDHNPVRPFVWAVVKADAYGHGLAHVMPALCHADGLAVLSVDDVRHCRGLGWKGPALAMRSPFTLNDLLDPELWPLHLVIDNPQQLAVLSKLDQPCDLSLWVRHAGALNHTGFQTTEFMRALSELTTMARRGLITSVRPFLHPAQAEQTNHFQQELAGFYSLLPGNANDSCAFNSAALLIDADRARRSLWVRSGILLYGVSPLPGQTGLDLGLRPAMTLQAPLYGIQTLGAGATIGYGGSQALDRRSRVGLVSCGYADGYPRHARPGTPALIDGQPTHLLGSVSMDLLAIDLTELPHAQPGSIVTLWGPDLPVEQVAHHAGTIAADLLSGLNARIHRQTRYKDSTG